MKAIFYIILAVVGLAGCRTAEQLTHKAIAKDAGKVQAITRALWPCITVEQDSTVKTDTLYDIISVECPPDTIWGTDTLEISEVRIKPGKVVYKEVPRIRETVTHTVRIKDTIDQEQLIREQERTKALKAGNRIWKAFAVIGWILAILLFLILIKRK